MAEGIEHILSAFQPVALAGLKRARLLTRSDEKYLCRIDQLPGILETACPDFQVLEHLGKRLRGYESMYLDTPDHEMYLRHHNGKLNRYKIRIREYTDTHEFFFEIKFKDNHLETTKKRIRIGPGRNYRSGEIREFMSKHTVYSPEMLVPVLYSSFDRLTLVNQARQERITIDINPSWHTGTERITLGNVVIMEVKSAKNSSSEGFGYLLREARIHPRRLSKYCTGTALLFPEIKHNRFKAKLLHLKKLDKNIT